MSTGVSSKEDHLNQFERQVIKTDKLEKEGISNTDKFKQAYLQQIGMFLKGDSWRDIAGYARIIIRRPQVSTAGGTPGFAAIMECILVVWVVLTLILPLEVRLPSFWEYVTSESFI